MPNAVMFITFKLVKGASVADFLLAAEKLNNEYMSKQKGYISWKQLVDGEMWADLITWETMEELTWIAVKFNFFLLRKVINSASEMAGMETIVIRNKSVA